MLLLLLLRKARQFRGGGRAAAAAAMAVDVGCVGSLLRETGPRRETPGRSSCSSNSSGRGENSSSSGMRSIRRRSHTERKTQGSNSSSDRSSCKCTSSSSSSGGVSLLRSFCCVGNSMAALTGTACRCCRGVRERHRSGVAHPPRPRFSTRSAAVVLSWQLSSSSSKGDSEQAGV